MRQRQTKYRKDTELVNSYQIPALLLVGSVILCMEVLFGGEYIQSVHGVTLVQKGILNVLGTE